jgi:hypothetical protein
MDVREHVQSLVATSSESNKLDFHNDKVLKQEGSFCGMTGHSILWYATCETCSDAFLLRLVCDSIQGHGSTPQVPRI